MLSAIISHDRGEPTGMKDRKKAKRILDDRAAAFNSFKFHWEVGDMVAGSAMPGRYRNIADDCRTLKEEGIEIIINLTCTTLEIPSEFEGCFEVLHVPVLDGQAPDRHQLNKIMAVIRDAVPKGKRAVIHCRGGIGRTATVLTPLLMELEDLCLEEAEEKLRKSGRYTQSTEQREFLEAWAREQGKN